MLGKMLAGAVCTAVAASALVSCTDKKGGSATEKSSLSVTEEAVTTTEQATTQSPTVENVDIANFTAPEKGDTIIEMDIKDYGIVKFRLFPEYADKGVENFVELAKKGYYDGLKFHRVISD
ncbi:peptidylprolyl isomerase, partial [Ruminococcus flavefaciens]|uniref:peptidylprolyl isomerase n=1 Tax=Ruminococcus flavefaciens TaxID=1265 RepID=UPI00035CC3B5